MQPDRARIESAFGETEIKRALRREVEFRRGGGIATGNVPMGRRQH